jgi:hypothetical protein
MSASVISGGQGCSQRVQAEALMPAARSFDRSMSFPQNRESMPEQRTIPWIDGSRLRRDGAKAVTYSGGWYKVSPRNNRAIWLVLLPARGVAEGATYLGYAPPFAPLARRSKSRRHPLSYFWAMPKPEAEATSAPRWGPCAIWSRQQRLPCWSDQANGTRQPVQPRRSARRSSAR